MSSRLFGWVLVAVVAFLAGNHTVQGQDDPQQRRGVSVTEHRPTSLSGYANRHALVIGSGRAAVWFAGVIEHASRVGYHLVGMLLNSESSGIPSFSFLTGTRFAGCFGWIQF